MRRPLVLFAVALVALAATAGDAAAAGTPAPLTWSVEGSPFRLTILASGKPLLRQHTGPAGPGTRLSFRTHDGSLFTLTRLLGTRTKAGGATYRVATSHAGTTATVTVKRIKLGLRVGLDLGSAADEVRTVYESFDSHAAEHFLGTGERRDYVDLSGEVVPIKVWHPCGSAKPAPFFLSSRGYGIRFRTAAVGRLAFGRVGNGSRCELGTSPCLVRQGAPLVQACFKTGSLSYEIYRGDPEQVVRAYASSTGRPPLPEPSQFALTKWRDRVDGEAHLTEDADRFEQAGIPLGWLILDNPWETAACVGTLQFDDAYPDPAAMVARLHERGLRLMLWVSPLVRVPCGEGLYPENRLLGPDEPKAIDLTDPAVAATFEQRLAGVLATGIDGFKVDRGDSTDFELTQLAGGWGGDIHNTYPILLADSIARASRAARGRLLPTLFRAGFTGSQSLETGAWSGDLPGNWDGIENAVRSAQTAGLVGFSTWGSDTGGYESPALTAEMFVRWAQLSAVTPVFEVGGDGPQATPWLLGEGAMDGLRTAVLLHYALFPYHYELARAAHRTGVPIVRPLALQYPADPRSWQAEYELLVGPDLLAAPFTHPGTTAHVYLPPGEWLDLGTGEQLVGPVSFSRPTPLGELPLYLRTGAAIPFNLREPQLWSSRWELNDLFRAGRGGWLVAAGDRTALGRSTEYGTLRATSDDKRTRVDLTGARRETQVVVLGRKTPRWVAIDGRVLPRSRSAAVLRSVRQGWLMKRGAFGGVVLKLAPRNGRSVVEIGY